MVSGPVLLKIKEKSWIFEFLGFKKNETKMKNRNEIGQILTSGALDDTKKMRNAGADIFAKSGPEKLQNNRNKSKYSPGFSPLFLWT